MRKNGFTLVELLGVLVIIGILSAISVAIYTNSINSSRNSLSDFQKKQLEEAARTYVAINTISFNNLFDDASVCVAIDNKVLNKEGLLNSEVLDPKDRTNLLNGHIRVEYDSNNNQYTYTYNSDKIEHSACKYKYILSGTDVDISVEE